jgi:hypothetical protein
MRVAKLLLIWLAILGLAFINGALRELVLVPSLGMPLALVISGIILSACILAVTVFALPKLGSVSTGEALGVGLLWLLLTLIFEFSFGRFYQHKSWGELMEAYAFSGGNIWPVVLLVIVSAPLVARRWCMRT